MPESPAAQHVESSPSAASDDPAVGRVLGDRYRLLASLGAGASARVYLAEDLSLGRRVAVKCLRPGLSEDHRFLRRFRAEAKAAAQLSHPNLLAVYDWGEQPTPYLITEVLLGGSLFDLLDRAPRLSPSQGLLIALQVAQGLNYAHDLGIVHRDIKPANLLFGVEGRLRIADFGIARAVAEAAWTEPEGVLVGTARYAAPEQALGDRIDGKADVYSLALTVIEAVTGRVPLLRENALATMVLRQDRDVVDLAGMGPLGAALVPAGRADPAARPSAAELIDALTVAARSLPRPERLPLVHPVEEPAVAPGSPTVVDLRPPPDDEVSPGTTGRVKATPIPRPDPIATDHGVFSLPRPVPVTDLPVPAPGRDLGLIDDLDDRDDDLDHLNGVEDLDDVIDGVPDPGTVDAAPAFAPSSAEVDPLAAQRKPPPADRGVYPSIKLARVAPSPFDVDLGLGLGDNDTEPEEYALGEPGADRPLVVDADDRDRSRSVPDPDLGFKRRWLVPLAAGCASVLAVGLALWAVLGNEWSGTETVASSTLVAPIVVGDYVGLTVEDIEPEMEANGWDLVVTELRQDGADEGTIIAQSPAPGETLGARSALDVDVSIGPELRTVPDLIGLTVEDASSILRTSGLELGVVTSQHDDRRAEGEVMIARIGGVEAGAEAEPGTAVDLVVSAGPASVAMPSFVGLTLPAALDQADGLGLVVTQAEAFSDVYDEGFIVDTTPPTNTSVRPGDQLTLVVSLGAPFVRVPDVTGLDPASAADVLADAGFAVTDTDGPPNLPVIATTPAAGESQRKGSPVVVHTSVG